MYTLPIPQTGSEAMPRTAATESSTKPFILSGVLDKILKEAISPYHFLTARQITRLLYPTEKQGMFTTIKARLKDLTDAKYVYAFHMKTANGIHPYVYCLGMRGRKYLLAEGLDILVYYEPFEVASKTYGTLAHTLELNDFLISAATIHKAAPDFHLYAFLHDFAIKTNPATTLDQKGKVVQIAPDGFLDIRSTTRRYCYLVEHDRGHIGDDRMKKKFTDYLSSWKQQKLREHYNTLKHLEILFPTSAGVKRVERMRDLCRQVLITLDEKDRAFFRNLFKFTAVPPLLEQPLDSKTLFFSPLWLTAYGEPTDTHALIDLTQ